MPQPSKIPLAFAASGDKNVIPESTETTGLASWRDGFPAITSMPFSEGGIAPKRADFNGIFNALSLATVWQQQGGFYEYDAATDYEPGNVVEYNNELYKCITANGPSSAVKAPTDATIWSKVMTAADVAALYVPLAGGTMTGSLKAKMSATCGTAPASKVEKYFPDYIDANNTRYGLLQAQYNTDMSSEMALFAYKTTSATGNNIGRLGIGCNSNGAVYTVAPTPANTDNSTNIATTAFVHNFALPLSGGTLTGDVVLTSGKKIVASNNTSWIALYGGTGWADGVLLQLFGKNDSSNPGAFVLRADDGSLNHTFIGRPDGTLTWGGKNIAVVDSVDSTNSGYIRFTNGVQILWSNVNVTSESGTAVTFEKAFSSAPCIFTNVAFANSYGYGFEGQAQNRTTTGFTAYIGSSKGGTAQAYATGNMNYLAIGPWA